MKLLIGLTIVLFYVNSIQTDKTCANMIEYDVLNSVIYNAQIPDTFETYYNFSTNPQDKIKLVTHSCYGHADFKVYDSNMAVLIVGHYCESTDTVWMERNVHDLFTGKINLATLPSFKPLRHGKWIYFDGDDTLKIEHYNNGHLSATKWFN